MRRGEFGLPVVLKADGLAAGKGVVIAEDRAAAERAIADAMSERKFGAAGDRLVIEECLAGPEVSFFVLCDGARAVPIGTAQDHKRIFDDDRGPNTGGMGAFAPSPLVDAALEARVMREIVDPVIAGMAAEGHPFRGFLFVGLMLTADGPKVIEFNVRLGDPEAQVILPLIDEPLLPLLVAGATGRAARVVGPDRRRTGSSASCSRRAAIPSRPSRASRSTGIDAAEAIPGVAVYHAGTARRDGQTRHRRRPRADRRRPRRRLRGSDRARLRRRRCRSRSTACSTAATSGRRALAREVPKYEVDVRGRTVKYAVVTFGCRVNQADSLGFEEELLAARRGRRRRRRTPIWSSSTPVR